MRRRIFSDTSVVVCLYESCNTESTAVSWSCVKKNFAVETVEETQPVGHLPKFQIGREKWGSSLDAGFQIIPDVLIRSQSLLGLDALDVVILLNITTHWWEADNLPHPRPSAIARRMGVTTRTVERRLIELHKKEFLLRLKATKKDGRTVRPYDLSGLVEKLQKMATAQLIRRRAQSRTRIDRPTDSSSGL